jgi:hypothetical protein
MSGGTAHRFTRTCEHTAFYGAEIHTQMFKDFQQLTQPNIAEYLMFYFSVFRFY